MQGYFSFSSTANFLTGPATLPDPFSIPAETSPEREALRVLVIGSRKGVINTIHTLHRLGFAEVGEWSPLLPAPAQGEVMSILTRYIRAD
jgi:hypothetical protein